MRGIEHTEADGEPSPLRGGSDAGDGPRIRIPHSLLMVGTLLVEAIWIAGLAYLVYRLLT
jgi:hypothetical protein